jgi:hypothetical protein
LHLKMVVGKKKKGMIEIAPISSLRPKCMEVISPGKLPQSRHHPSLSSLTRSSGQNRHECRGR